MAPSSRLAVRLAQLPHDALVQLFTHEALAEFTAQLCADNSAVAAQAEAVLAAHRPVPQWAVEGVLLSSDLVPHLLAPLELEDGAAAAACSAWAAGWRGTNEPRRRLRQAPLEWPVDLVVDFMHMATIPGDEERLVVQTGSKIRILDRSMRTVAELDEGFGSVAANEQSIFLASSDWCRRLSHDGTELASYVEEGRNLSYPALAPGGLLFCVAFINGRADEDEIVALDAETLELRYRFGQSLLDDAYDMAVGGEELFVCDKRNDRLQVFSLAGEHRRSITGEWKKPEHLCCIKDRLYLTEADEWDDEDEEGGVEDGKRLGQRIFVLSLQGDTLYTYGCPIEEHVFSEICGFDGKLLAAHSVHGFSDPFSDRFNAGINGVIALRGV